VAFRCGSFGGNRNVHMGDICTLLSPSDLLPCGVTAAVHPRI
jgi:hypothetical protein